MLMLRLQSLLGNAEIDQAKKPNYITMISNTDAAGVYTDADHNTTEMSIIDLFEPAGMFSALVSRDRGD